MRTTWSRFAGAAFVSLTLAVACSGGDDGDTSGGGTAGVGDPCSGDECRRGLACSPGGVCQPAGTISFGSPCTISGECKQELQCVDGRCINAGEGQAGDACLADSDCVHGMRCGIVGFGAQCIPEGNTDLGGSCATPTSCFSGLTCVGGECQKTPAGGSSLGAAEFPGVTCAPISAGTVRAFFEVPGVSDPPGQAGDFFRLPFPNDLLFEDGKLNLKGFPTPGAALLGYDPVKIYVDALSESATGWGTYPAVIFRFSGHIDFDSFQFVEGGKKPVQWVDITPGDDFGRTSGLRWVANEAGGKYVCSDYFAVQRPQGSPMLPGHSYAVFLTTDGTDKSGNAIERAPQFEALLADAAPGDPVLASAHAKYAGFRSYLADQGIDPATILNATVITTEDVRAPMREVAEAVAAAPVPSASGWVRCDAGVQSPCPDAENDRGCQAEGGDFAEYHALIELPIFQTGEPPYLTSGGGIQTSVQRSESVCLSMTVPKGASMPTDGWPAVIFAHGTGGSFRSHVRDEVAGALAKATTPFVVIGIDQVQHGPRRGTSTESPNNLFFNFGNPAAARGNPIQGAADQLSLARFASALDLTAGDTGSDAVKVDPLRVVFFGHSQGATEGSLAVPYAPEFRAAVLSGNGASLKDSLLTKTEPVNIKAAVPLVLGDFSANLELVGGTNHPALTLLQQWIDPADPLNFAGLWRAPETDMVQKSVFQTYGLGDNFSTPVTLATYIQAGRLDLAKADSSANPPDPISGVDPQSGAVSGNLGSDTETLTLGARQYGPPGDSDGHFVVFDVPAANADMVRFLVAAAQGMTPSVGQ
ncbi:MAG: hypothetical protein KC766_19655 [Myxococcales bacterium]|nr:hypothetical protein [Myxococcales bacterium]